MKILLYCLVVCGIIVISLRLYTIYTICISPDSFFEPNLPREELILVTGKSLSNVLMSVELISEIVQGNSATSEESAAASEELSAQAQILKELVGKFEL